MGFMDKIKDAFNVPEEDYYDEEESYTEKKASKYDKYDDDKYDRITTQPAESFAASPSSSSANRVVNIHATTQLQVVLVKPERFDDAPAIANHLNDKKTVVVNLESAPKDIQRRLIDFLSGVAYANRGQIKRVANSTFIITPFNVDIMGDMLIDELESNGMYI